MEVVQYLVQNLEPEGRYIFISGLANQLRYPNKHTHIFSCIILFLFASVHANVTVKEQVIRVLLERLVVQRPHPWGLLVTFIEIMKNGKTYRLWNYPFAHSYPRITSILYQIHASCHQYSAGEAKGGAVGPRGAVSAVSAVSNPTGSQTVAQLLQRKQVLRL